MPMITSSNTPVPRCHFHIPTNRPSSLISVNSLLPSVLPIAVLSARQYRRLNARMRLALVYMSSSIQTQGATPFRPLCSLGSPSFDSSSFSSSTYEGFPHIPFPKPAQSLCYSLLLSYPFLLVEAVSTVLSSFLLKKTSICLSLVGRLSLLSCCCPNMPLSETHCFRSQLCTPFDTSIHTLFAKQSIHPRPYSLRDTDSRLGCSHELP